MIAAILDLQLKQKFEVSEKKIFIGFLIRFHDKTVLW